MSYWSFSIDDQVALVSPKEEAPGTLTLDAVSELSEVLETLGALTSTVAVVVISGGQHGRFLSDVDRSQFGISQVVNGEEVAVKTDRSAWARLAVTLLAIPPPTVAAIDGPASGGGNVIALHCTLRIGSERAAFAPFDFGLGIAGTHSVPRLVRLVGASSAADLLMTRRVVDAEDARRIGLLTVVLATDGFIGQVRGWCEPIAANPDAFGIKRSIVAEDFVGRAELWPDRPWKGAASRVSPEYSSEAAGFTDASTDGAPVAAFAAVSSRGCGC
jgi:enoyl-CoA hydratase